MSIPVSEWTIEESGPPPVCAARLYLTGETAPVLAVACDREPGHTGRHEYAAQGPQGEWQVWWQGPPPGGRDG